MSTQVYEISNPGAEKGTIMVWFADSTHYLLKMISVPASGPPITSLEVGAIAFAKPPASLFNPPAGCK